MAIEIDIDKFEKLIETNDFASAKKLLDDVSSQPLTEEEKGEIYAKIASAYLSAQHEINKKYIAQLDETIDLLETLNKSEKTTDEKLKIAQTKLDLLKDSE